ncbi:Cytochrome c oxidase subunit 2 precursor [Methyloligella halotolerans]|uniref:Cytochrome c oxidase subunit 2 n=1 Tax=Methyloligella halotolerans TaxID=1177755 RepID=A0A1E2RXC4_9HYPH|nr:c-type cytochrome [Methyloligella halotolerans]ODA66765.1 Cytochrome c oxidase subunit 2 precursor [Methyloligella halotolerans]
MRKLTLVFMAAGLSLLGGCDIDTVAAEKPTAAQRGADLIAEVGCGSCHTIPGIQGANGLVGPPLDQMARRIYIAGKLRNSPDNMVRWILNPQKVSPGNAMPDMGLTESQAEDITAYLATLE